MMTRRHATQPAACRRGIAAVEFAVCVPLLVLLFLGSIECANIIYLKQTLTLSSYEGVRKAIQFNSNNTQALARANDILTARNIQGASVTFVPADVATVPRGSEIAVTVSAPCGSNSSVPVTIFAGETLSVTIKMRKE
jgi:Flp pilus assembly protein TadG